MQLIYEDYDKPNNAYYKLHVDNTDNYFYIDIGGDTSFEFDQKTHLKFLEEVEKYQYSNFVFNLVNQKSSTVKGRIWFVSYVVKKGYRIVRGKKMRGAVISSSTSLQKAVISILMSSITRVVPNTSMKSFDSESLEEAINWIKEGKDEMLLAS